MPTGKLCLQKVVVVFVLLPSVYVILVLFWSNVHMILVLLWLGSTYAFALLLTLFAIILGVIVMQKWAI